METNKKQLVKIKPEFCNSIEESQLVFIIKEDLGNRVRIEPINSNMNIIPNEICLKNYLIFLEN